MGYETKYSLKWEPVAAKDLPRCEHAIPKGAKFCPECGLSAVPQSVCEAVSMWLCLEQQRDSEFRYAIDHKGQSQGATKWYQYEKDMEKLSKRFPDVLFTLHGDGEDSSDVWNQYFLAGKSHKETAKIVIAPFDKSKLQ